MARTSRASRSKPSADAGDSPFHHRVWAVVAAIPRGRVASYKDVGLFAGYPRSARFVARVMKVTAASNVPWHRVVGSDGSVRIQDPALRAEQMRRLRAEGVTVDDRGRFPYARFAWSGPTSGGSRAAGSAAARRRP